MSSKVNVAVCAMPAVSVWLRAVARLARVDAVGLAGGRVRVGGWSWIVRCSWRKLGGDERDHQAGDLATVANELVVRHPRMTCSVAAELARERFCFFRGTELVVLGRDDLHRADELARYFLEHHARDGATRATRSTPPLENRSAVADAGAERNPDHRDLADGSRRRTSAIAARTSLTSALPAP